MGLGKNFARLRFRVRAQGSGFLRDGAKCMSIWEFPKIRVPFLGSL